FLGLRLQAQAVKHRLRSHIRERCFESERLERSYFRSTLDHKAHAQTAEALKRRMPGIRALAKRYNTLCAQLSDMKARSAIHKNAVIPKPVDINGLFDIGVDDAIWEDAGLDGDAEEAPPAWLADEGIREGIKAMLMYDQ
ncbi:hypothetical protein BS47DRAFT_1282585, partial [Hydnum rufescens UP504]